MKKSPRYFLIPHNYMKINCFLTYRIYSFFRMKKEFHRTNLHFTENIIFLLNESDIVWLEVGNDKREIYTIVFSHTIW